MRGIVPLLIISLPVAMLIAVGLYSLGLGICASWVPSSPIYELCGIAAQAVVEPDSEADFYGALTRLWPAVTIWSAWLGTIACLLAGMAGGAMSRDAHRAVFAAVPLLTLWALPLRTMPWTLAIALLWALAAMGGAALVRRRTEEASDSC